MDNFSDIADFTFRFNKDISLFKLTQILIDTQFYATGIKRVFLFVRCLMVLNSQDMISDHYQIEACSLLPIFISEQNEFLRTNVPFTVVPVCNCGHIVKIKDIN
ncbi:hypothetical protein BpHYR1_036441 [Brachionus plicatilis]|uniref:Uncharacterized protein n=1 Tax=Brachionus plicatilis TaxID=10195 RepID=A0A3M7PZ81_BRAPC|nr:hypothetical protein BpHYR1_036441 [Brachionus plicatilis]